MVRVRRGLKPHPFFPNAHLCDKRIALKLRQAGFRRSATAVHLKLKRTKLRQNTPYYSATGLAGLFGCDAHLVMRWIKSGYLKSKPKGTKRTDAQGGDIHLIHHRDVRRFVVEHPLEFDIRKVDQLWFVDLLTNNAAGI